MPEPDTAQRRLWERFWLQASYGFLLTLIDLGHGRTGDRCHRGGPKVPTLLRYLARVADIRTPGVAGAIADRMSRFVTRGKTGTARENGAVPCWSYRPRAADSRRAVHLMMIVLLLSVSMLPALSSLKYW